MADTVGNRLGERGTFIYEDDTGVAYNIRLDDSVSRAIGNDRSTSGNLRILRASQAFPLKPRYVLLSLDSDPKVTKKVIVGDNQATRWVSNAPDKVTINGAVYTITTRVGERRSTVPVDAPAEP